MIRLYFFNTHYVAQNILLVYVDDIIITRTDPDDILRLQKILHASFHMKDLSLLSYFLGLEVHKFRGFSHSR